MRLPVALVVALVVLSSLVVAGCGGGGGGGGGATSTAPASATQISSPSRVVVPALGQSFSYALVATGGTAPYQWSVVAGTLPAGLALSLDGVLSGTPAQQVTSVVRVRATDAIAASSEQDLTLEVRPPLVFAPQTLASAQEKAAYTVQLDVTGGQPPFTFAVKTGALPAGVVLSATGLLSGTPTVAGSFPFTIEATGTDCSGTIAYTLDVAAAPTSTTPPTGCG